MRQILHVGVVGLCVERPIDPLELVVQFQGGERGCSEGPTRYRGCENQEIQGGEREGRQALILSYLLEDNTRHADAIMSRAGFGSSDIRHPKHQCITVRWCKYTVT